MIHKEEIEVLIVGAGPVGLFLALDLGRRGVRSTIIEKAAGPATALNAKASVLNERTMEYCRLVGVRDQVANAGYPDDLPGDTLFCTSLNGKFIGRLEMPEQREREIPVESSEMLQRCPQFLFDPLLERNVKERGMSDIRYGMEFVGCEQDSHGTKCFLKAKDGASEEVRARYVVGCDGPASNVRKSLGIPFEGKNLGFTLSAILEIPDFEHCHPWGRMAERFLFIGPDGTWGNFTTIDGKSLWRFSLPGGQEKMPEEKIDIHALARKALGRDDIRYEVKQVLQWRRSQFTADQYGKGRVLLAGDAAHTMSPTGGHGLNTGLGDIMNLSWMLQAALEGWGDESLFEAYNAERRPIAIRNGAGSTRNFSIWIDKSGREKVLDDGPEAEEQRKALGQKMATNLRQEFQSLGLALGYNYADSPIVAPDGSLAPPDEPDVCIQTARPGHRAPHVWLKDGRSTVDIFKGGFTLARFGRQKPDDTRLAQAAKKVDMPLEYVDITDTEAMAVYQTRLVLVRPDGMVAWRGDVLPDDVGGLLDHVRGSRSKCSGHLSNGHVNAIVA